MRIAVRADASRQIGSGHVMRMLALAERLRAGGATVEFLCLPLAGHLCDRIEGFGFTVHRLAPAGTWEQDLEATRRALPAGADWLVVDHYALDRAWESGARAICPRIFAADDLAREHDCDVLLDQNFHADAAARYAGRVEARCETLLGPRYALLREEFVDAGREPRVRDGGVRRLLVSFGGQDAGGETLKALRALELLPRRGFAIDVTAASTHAHLDDLRKLCQGLDGCTLHLDSDGMAALMQAADLAIGAGGGSMWERCATGLPAILVSIAPNQSPSSAAMADAGNAVHLGPSAAIDAQGIAAAVAGLLADPSRLRRMSAQCAALMDGRGTRRASARILADTISLRRAEEGDCDRLHQWRNAEINRRQAFDPADVPLARHRAWFAERLRDASCDLLVAERASQPAGVLRYDRKDGEARISIYLVPGQHGKGLGRLLLVRGTRWLRQQHPTVRAIVADIRETNDASIRAFTDAGYERHGASYACVFQ